MSFPAILFLLLIGVFLGVLFAPLGMVALTFLVIVVLWALVVFFRAEDCDGEEFLSLFIPLGAFCVTFALMQHERVDVTLCAMAILIAVSVCGVLYVLKHCFCCQKR